MILGENFPGELIGERGLFGFYATRFVEAETVEEAELTALAVLRNDPALQTESEMLKQQEPQAKVYFEEIIEVDQDSDRSPNKGATWFEME